MGNDSMKRQKYSTTLFILLLVVCWIIAAAGCGKKGPPRAPEQILPPPVSDLRARVVNGNMTLYWSVPPEPEDVTVSLEGYYVLKASSLAGADMCAECPRIYHIAAEPLISMATLQKDGRVQMTYVEQLRRGFRYTYKVRGFTKYGNTGDDSNTIEFLYGVEAQPEGAEPQELSDE